MPLYILGSSLFGAQLAARLGLPYAFASHFAPDALEQAVHVYRRDFRPSAQLDAPYVIAGLNVLAADTRAEAEAQLIRVQRSRVRALIGRGQNWSDEEADAVLASPAGGHVTRMTRYRGVGGAFRSESVRGALPGDRARRRDHDGASRADRGRATAMIELLAVATGAAAAKV